MLLGLLFLCAREQWLAGCRNAFALDAAMGAGLFPCWYCVVVHLVCASTHNFIMAATDWHVMNTQDERQDGIALDSRFKEQGRVPLFYVADDKDDKLYLYFSRLDLVTDWNTQHPSDAATLPARIRTIDLVGIFESLVRQRDTKLPLDKVVFVPNRESVAVAKELASRSSNGRLVPYNANLMII
jgi:hypothetical protein